MNTFDKNYIIDRYSSRLKEFGATIDALLSGTEKRRNLRFKTLLEIGIEEGDTILDLGCGFGDLYRYIKESKYDIKYIGIDINSDLIDQAKKRFPEAQFITGDIEEINISNIDYILSTSCFNLRLNKIGNMQHAANILNRCYELSKKGVAIDFLTSYVDFKGNEKEAFYYNPEEIFKIAKSITKRVTLRHDYPLFEFCLYLYPDFKGWGKI